MCVEVGRFWDEFVWGVCVGMNLGLCVGGRCGDEFVCVCVCAGW